MANQYEVDPRQALFLKAYLDPKSETFSNAYQSALSVGYSEEYAKTILSQDVDWLSENLNTEAMVRKAEKKLEKLMDSEDEKIQLDSSKFVAGRLGKAKWSEKTLTEHSGRVEMVQTDGKLDKLAEQLDASNKASYEAEPEG